MTILKWILALLAAIIMVQTLWFKFSGSPESVYIFTELGMEPWGRYGSGVVELIASLLLLLPSIRIYGAILGLAVICAALFFHLSTLGIEVMNDRGQLFIYALVVFVCCLTLIIIEREQIFDLFRKK